MKEEPYFDDNTNDKKKKLLDKKKDNEKTIKDKEEIEELSTYYHASICSKILFAWTHNVMRTAKKKPLAVNDLKGVGKSDKSQTIFVPLHKNWYGTKENPGCAGNNKAFFYAILKTNWIWIVLLTLLELCIDIFKYCQVFFYREVMLYFKHYHNKNSEKSPILPIFISALGFILIKVFKTFFHHQVKFKAQILGVKAANQVTSLIYDKVMKTSIFIKSQISEGEILNFIQVDADKLNFLFTSLPKILTVPINFVVSFYALFLFFKQSFIYGLLMFILCLIIIWIIQKKYLENTEIMLKKKDARMRLTTHTLHIIKILKLFGWEDEFREKIDMKRNDELSNIKNIYYLTAFRNFFNSNIPLLISIACIGGFTYMNGMLEITALLTSIELVEQVATPMVNIPQFLTDLYSLLISMSRLQKFLNVKDIKEKNIQKETEINEINKDENSHEPISNHKHPKTIAVYFKNCNFGIKENNNDNNNNKEEEELQEINENNIEVNNKDKLMLSQVNLTINKGELTIIIGETGSGKSCLINAILGNLEILNDQAADMQYLISPKKISYASQDPWIMNGTIKDNIVFYEEFNQTRYSKVLSACQLNEDLNLFPHGDMSEVGSGGLSLSGGQRARVALARAIYRNADIYILDDPVSAVDNFVSMKIFHQAIVELLKGKTRVVVGHDLRNLGKADRVILMKHFKISFDDSFSIFSETEHYKELMDDKQENINNKKKNKESLKNPILSKDITEIAEYHIKNNYDETIGKLLKDEDQEKGKVRWRIYDVFIKVQGGYILFAFLIALTVCKVIAGVKGKIYLSNWSDTAENKGKNEDNLSHFFIYSMILFVGVLIQFIKEMGIADSNFKSTKLLHEKMIKSLILAPINLFHDIVPIGQLLNRLIFDLENESQIIWKFDKILTSLIGLCSAIYVCYLFNPSSLIISPVLSAFAIFLIFYFLPSARDLGRLDGVSRSPVVSLFSETISGVSSIRAFNGMKEFQEKCNKRLDQHLSVMISKFGTDNWFCMHLDVVSHGYLAFVVAFAVMRIDFFNAAAVGLMLSYSSKFSEQLLETMEQTTHVEKSLISLERCDFFTRIPSELYENKKQNDIKEIEETNNWPSNGKIEFKNFSMKYRSNCDLALKNINLVIEPKTKVGIVGRTGSGKSSLTLAMFRIVEAFKGNILIDDIDIRNIPLKKLRRSISIVPQEPFLLEGTLRTNLDPLDLYRGKDEEIKKVLKEVKLFDMIKNDNLNSSSIEDIDMPIKEYGNNMSFGCRQLICVARAILRKSKVIILDEATSSVDQKTEDIISNAVEKLYNESTVITIAHRINTVKKCDIVIVMEAGEIVEKGKPEILIKDIKSKFYSLYYKYMEETQ